MIELELELLLQLVVEMGAELLLAFLGTVLFVGCVRLACTLWRSTTIAFPARVAGRSRPRSVRLAEHHSISGVEARGPPSVALSPA